MSCLHTCCGDGVGSGGVQDQRSKRLPREEVLTLPWPEPRIRVLKSLPRTPGSGCSGRTGQLRGSAVPGPPPPNINRESQTSYWPPNFVNCAVRRVNPKPFASADVEHLGAFVSEYADGSAQSFRSSSVSTQQGFSGSDCRLVSLMIGLMAGTKTAQVG